MIFYVILICQFLISVAFLPVNNKLNVLTFLQCSNQYLNEPSLRIGHGFDIHRLIEGTKLVIGGVHIPFHLGADAHSDGDALYHR
jgi:hypothetical protein